MTTRAIVTFELSLLFEGDALQEIGIEGMSNSRMFPHSGSALSNEDRDRVWCALPEWLQERLLADAVTLYEPVGDDDYAAEDSRMPGAAE